MSDTSFLDDAPGDPQMTDYDRRCLKSYMRLLDSVADGADWKEVVKVIFGIDPTVDMVRARRVYDSHLRRAEWVSSQGYLDLIDRNKSP